MKAWLKWTLGIVVYLVVGILLNRVISAPIVEMQQENPLNFYGFALLSRFILFWTVYLVIGIIGYLLFVKKLGRKK